MSVRYSYNRADIDAGVITSGTAKAVGEGADFDRIKNLAPCQLGINALVGSTPLQGLSVASVAGSKLTGTGSGVQGTTAKSIALELSKVSGKLNAKITLS
jgi:hypothetical protein